MTIAARLNAAIAASPAPSLRRVVLIGCGKAKASKPAPVRALYTSTLFRKEVELASLIGHATFVVSAAHGLLTLDQEIKPYDVDLRNMPLSVRKQWGEDIAASLLARTLDSSSRLQVTILAGEIYARPIVEAIHRARNNGSPRWTEPHDLLFGKQVGERLSALNRAIATARDA